MERKTVILLICSIFLIAIGIFTNEGAIVFQKAAKICLECIGLG